MAVAGRSFASKAVMLAPVTLVSFARAGDVPPPPPDPVLAQRGDIIVRDDPAALPA